MLVVLRQRNDVTFGRYLQSAAPAHLDVRTFEFSDETPVALEHGDVKPVSVAVADKNVAGVADVDPVRVAGDVLAPDAMEKLPVLVEHDHRMSLKWRQARHETAATTTQRQTALQDLLQSTKNVQQICCAGHETCFSEKNHKMTEISSSSSQINKDEHISKRRQNYRQRLKITQFAKSSAASEELQLHCQIVQTVFIKPMLNLFRSNRLL